MSADVEIATSAFCLECGAPAAHELTCWEQLNCLLAWETQDAELAAAHFLTVAAYNLQHPAQFGDEALVAPRVAFVEHLDKGVAVAEIRRRMGAGFAGARCVLKPGAERMTVPRAWTLTIDYAYAGGRPARAALRVRRWAWAIRQDLAEGGV